MGERLSGGDHEDPEITGANTMGEVPQLGGVTRREPSPASKSGDTARVIMRPPAGRVANAMPTVGHAAMSETQSPARPEEPTKWIRHIDPPMTGTEPPTHEEPTEWFTTVDPPQNEPKPITPGEPTKWFRTVDPPQNA